jgi:hypothetical protein
MRTVLLGPFELAFDSIERELPPAVCGVFALGYVDAVNTFRVQLIGRDDDLRRRLRELIGSSTRFKFAVSMSPQAAFERECELFHKFRPPGNIIHPDRPEGANWLCPVCARFHP